MGVAMTEHMLDQLVFGYRDGHQLLGGSRQLEPRDLRLLLGATDMSIEGPSGRFLTGLRLATRAEYAICATWAAPEQPRPGAVWAHVVIIPDNVLGSLDDPMSVSSALTRPDGTDLGRYGTKVAIPQRTADIDDAPPRRLLEAAVDAAYGTRGSGVVIEPNLDLAEQAVAALWRAQWAALRLEFTFRTRASARSDKPAADLVIARRVRGTVRPTLRESSPVWVRLVADAIECPAQSTFSSFLNEFGPLEPAHIRSVGVLANVFRRLSEGSTDAVREALEESYPSPQAGTALKLSLFGPGSDRPWSGSESERIHSLVSSTVDAWDIEALDLSARVEALMDTQGPIGVSEALTGTSTGVTDAVLHALVRRAHPSDIAGFIPAHPELVGRLIDAIPGLLNDVAAWRGLSTEEAGTLLKGISPDEIRSLVAAIHAGFGTEVLHSAGLTSTANAIALAGTYDDASSTLYGQDPSQLVAASTDDRLTLLVVALWGEIQVPPDLPVRLERTRENVDEFWLRAAVEAIASSALPARDVLPVAFGPLHNAITADRLPRECWSRLDDVLPIAPDPALRLRRYLLNIARDQQWNSDKFESALRGAGPHAGQLMQDFSGDDDWWVAAARAVVRTTVGLLGGRY
jgi:hypothetical protein